MKSVYDFLESMYFKLTNEIYFDALNGKCNIILHDTPDSQKEILEFQDCQACVFIPFSSSSGAIPFDFDDLDPNNLVLQSIEGIGEVSELNESEFVEIYKEGEKLISAELKIYLELDWTNLHLTADKVRHDDDIYNLQTASVLYKEIKTAFNLQKNHDYMNISYELSKLNAYRVISFEYDIGKCHSKIICEKDGEKTEIMIQQIYNASFFRICEEQSEDCYISELGVCKQSFVPFVYRTSGIVWEKYNRGATFYIKTNQSIMFFSALMIDLNGEKYDISGLSIDNFVRKSRDEY